jgi:hypothetical protein
VPETLDHWDVSGRDVVPNLSAGGRPRDIGAALLHALLTSSGMTWAPPYEDIRTNLQIRRKTILPELEDQKDQRIRTWEVLFSGLGLMYVEDGLLQATKTGKRLLGLLNEQYTAVDDFGLNLSLNNQKRLARLVLLPLAKYQLSSPMASSQYPAGTDIRPLLAIWRVMRSLDNKLHWEELGRQVTACLREDDLPDVIERIKNARRAAGYDPNDPVSMTSALGVRRPDKGANQSDRLDTWFSRAAFKSIFLEQQDRPDGYRHLRGEFVPLLDEVLASPPDYNSTTDIAEYVRWLGETPEVTEESPASTFEAKVQQVVARCRRYGSSHIVALVGPAGTGKTTIAQRAAAVLTDGDDTRVMTVQFHASFTYEEFVAGLVPTAGGGFEPAAGTLLQINKLAEDDPNSRMHVLIVDEFSRADVGNVLGELLTYVEYRGRPFRVPALNQDIAISPNLVIIATLNPSDRSVVNMDDALVRRLRQVQVKGDPEALAAILNAEGMEPALRAAVVEWFRGLPDDLPFGHGPFVGVKNEEDLRLLWEEELQYFLRRGGLTLYADPQRVERGYIWREWKEELSSAEESSSGSRGQDADESQADGDSDEDLVDL